MFQLLLLLCAFIFNNIFGQVQLLPPSCNSTVYCSGQLLRTVQMARIFNDSKSFVDMKIRTTPETVLSNFNDLMVETNQNPTNNEIELFVEENFEDGNELSQWIPPDFTPNPPFLNDINDSSVRAFAQEIVQLWPVLGRITNKTVFENTEQYSLIPVPNGLIVPGGRFGEFYYWDSYWIVKGLLISNMSETARGMIENFIYLVKQYGFIPNGGRVYYLNRSQPPLLTAMVAAYFQHTNDVAWLRQNLRYVSKELSFWLQNRLITVMKNGCRYKMARYQAESEGPRPESYYEDEITASFFTDTKRQQAVYSDLKSAAESGWDFSTRWFFDENGNIENVNLTNIATRRVIPVDLNAILCGAFKDISNLYLVLGDVLNSVVWLERALHWQKAIEKVLWNEEDGIWYDYDVQLSRQRRYFYGSNVAPLWTGAYNKFRANRIGQSVYNYINRMGIFNYLGGVPASLFNSGEQWDLTNSWPPLQAMIVQGLEKTGNRDARNAAQLLARRWVAANMKGFAETGEMFEKYDAVEVGNFGGGGEYTVQSGFGWTNGIALEFIKTYFST